MLIFALCFVAYILKLSAAIGSFLYFLVFVSSAYRVQTSSNGCNCIACSAATVIIIGPCQLKIGDAEDSDITSLFSSSLLI